MCALTSTHLNDFSEIVTYILYVMITVFFFGGGGGLGGSWEFWGGSFYPSNTLDRTPFKS